MSSSEEKLALIRAAIREKGINACIIPSADPHMGEYPPDHWKIIRWLTGFTGSSATVVITETFAGLWTDSRYFIQAGRQLSRSGFEFVRTGEADNGFMDYLAMHLKSGDRIGIDGRIFSLTRFRKLNKRLEGKGIEIVQDFDPVTILWSDRPALPSSLAFDHELRFCGRDRSAKADDVREKMRQMGVDYHFLSSPDDIMWLLNIRGRDTEFCPLLLSFALVGLQQILLFTDEARIPLKIASDFDRLGIILLPYEECPGLISSVTEGAKVLIDPASISVDIYNSLKENSEIIEGLSIPGGLKAIKNNSEIENISAAMVKDGVALTKFFFWFFSSQLDRATEAFLSDKLREFRMHQENFIGLSFAAIIAFNENSALPHYTPEGTEGSVIGERGLLLIDSGGQYLDGTTDITRTVAVGIPTQEQKRDFTLVLKGHINIALAKFPAGTRGYQLDILARKSLWENGLNFSHGTGHGVGFCLNVHEGPQSISPAVNRTSIEPGMLISNEPAIYREGEYGIRIENLVLCYEDEETEFGRFFRFDTVSLCYLDKSLIDISLLEKNEIDWVNSYHSEIYEKLSPFLSSEENNWLRDKTAPLK